MVDIFAFLGKNEFCFSTVSSILLIIAWSFDDKVKLKLVKILLKYPCKNISR